MRVLGRNFLLILLMIAARYAPLERAGEILPGRKVHAPPVVTGSVAVPQPASQSAPQRQADGTMSELARSQIGAILGGTQVTPEGKSAPHPEQKFQARGVSRRNRADRFDEIFIGGTGLPVGDAAAARPPHPLALANPESFVVICEAGCRPASDQIVYKISKTSAAADAIAKRRFEVTAATAGIASAGDAAVCVAGCYRDESARRHHAGFNGAPSQTASAAAPAAAPAPKTAQWQDDLRLGAEVYEALASAVQRPAPRGFGRLPAEAVAVATATLDTRRVGDAASVGATQAASYGIASDEALGTRHLISQETHVHAIKKRVAALAALSRRLSTTASTLQRTPITPLNQRAHTQAWLAVMARYAGSRPASVHVMAQLDQP